MFFLGKNKPWLSVIIAIAFISSFTGKMTPYLSNLSPYYSAEIEFEEKVFLRLAYEREQDLQKYEEGVKDSIKKVLVNFHTGLHPIYTEQHIPRLIFDESQKYGFDPLFGFDANRVRRCEFPPALNHCDLALPREPGKPLGELADHAVFPRAQLVDFDFRFA